MTDSVTHPIRRWATLILGLTLLASMLGSVQAAAPQASPVTPDDTVVIPPGNPVEIATTLEWGWDATPDHLDAIQMAMDDYGPIKGFPLQRNDYDGGCDLPSGQNAANQVVANPQNVGVLGCSCSSSTSGALPVLETAGVVLISATSTAVSLPALGPEVFNRTIVDDSGVSDWDRKIRALPSVLAWERHFEDTYGHYPDMFSRYAYDAARLLLTRIDEVSTIDGSGNLLIDRATLASAVRGTTGFTGVTDVISLDSTPGSEGNRLDLYTATGTRYVAITGDDSGGNDCADPAAPCASVQRGIALVDAGGSVLVAGGTYTENVTIGMTLTLEGGYEASGWTRALTQVETIFDGSSGQAEVGDWDGRGVRFPALIHDGGTYKMWYIGVDLYEVGRVGYATSPDGLNWSKDASNPVLDVGAGGEWDEASLEAPFVLKQGSAYKMWYSGRDADGTWRIGYATSSDGLTWTKHPSNPVLDLGSDDWNNSSVLHPYVIEEGGTYKMWLLAVGEGSSGQVPRMAYATSTDGITWAWDASNPIFGRDWELWLWRPAVRSTGTDYQMWYSAWIGEGVIAYATSPDETTWTKQGTVLTGTAGMWDEGSAINPYVLYEAGVYTMWYNSNTAIGVVTSTDGISWTRSISDPVLVPGDLGDEGQPVVSIEGVQAVLDGLTITGGYAKNTGGVHAGGKEVTIRHCKVRDNVAYGGASDAAAGGGINSSQSLIVEDSWILDNQVGGGAGGVRTADLIMTNVVLAGNTGDAAMHVNGALTLMNVTVTDNDSDIIFNPQTAASMSMTNTIVYNHENRQLEQWCSQFSCDINYSDIEGGWPTGTGNIDQNPLFVDPTTGDYHLQAGSPCIDAGTPDGAPATDIDGTLRDANPDMGAYESLEDLYLIYLPMVLSGSAP